MIIPRAKGRGQRYWDGTKLHVYRLRQMVGEAQMMPSVCLSAYLDGVLSLTMIETLEDEPVWYKRWWIQTMRRTLAVCGSKWHG